MLVLPSKSGTHSGSNVDQCSVDKNYFLVPLQVALDYGTMNGKARYCNKDYKLCELFHTRPVVTNIFTFQLSGYINIV